jgi:hypothetical protein
MRVYSQKIRYSYENKQPTTVADFNRFKSESSSYVNKYDWFNIRAAYGLSWGKNKKLQDEDE